MYRNNRHVLASMRSCWQNEAICQCSKKKHQIVFLLVCQTQVVQFVMVDRLRNFALGPKGPPWRRALVVPCRSPFGTQKSSVADQAKSDSTNPFGGRHPRTSDVNLANRSARASSAVSPSPAIPSGSPVERSRRLRFETAIKSTDLFKTFTLILGNGNNVASSHTSNSATTLSMRIIPSMFL